MSIDHLGQLCLANWPPHKWLDEAEIRAFAERLWAAGVRPPRDPDAARAPVLDIRELANKWANRESD